MELAMHVVRELKKEEAALLTAAVLSAMAHCLAAALLVAMVRVQPVAILPRIITVDIRDPAPAGAGAQAPAPRPARKAVRRPAAEPVREVRRGPAPVLRPVPPPDVTPPAAAAPAPDSSPVREAMPPQTMPHITAVKGDGLAHRAAPSAQQKGPDRAVRADGEQSAAASYLARLRELIERQREYPLMARRGRLQGTVQLRCLLARSGEVITVAVTAPSGHGILDNAALRAVRGTGRFPAVPAAITGDTFTFEVPVVFRLAAD